MSFFHRYRARSEAEATISNVEMVKRVNYGTATVRITYVVSPLAGASFEVVREAKVKMATLPQAGHQVRVSYDPERPQRLEVLTAPGDETGVVTTPTIELPYFNTGGVVNAGDIQQVKMQVRELAREQPPSKLEQLKKLGELRDSGVLTESEFDAEKAKILAES
jgi:Short C-terminal domain